MTKKKHLHSALMLFSAAIFFVACDRVTYKKFPDGTSYAVIKVQHDKADTQKVAVGKYIQIHIIQKLRGSNKKDTTILSTYESGVQGGEMVAEMIDGEGTKEFPLFKNLLGLKAGDSLIAKQSVANILKKAPQAEAMFGKKGNLVTSYKIYKVFNSQEDFFASKKVEKKTAFDDYVTKNNLASNFVAADSIYLKITSPQMPGAPAIKNGNFVEVNYVGKLLNGKVFDSNIQDVPGKPSNPSMRKPLGFTVGVKQMIPGFDAAMKYLAKGAKATIVLPYDKAYGIGGEPRAGIEPYETLIFDIEVVSVADKAPAPLAPPAISNMPRGGEQHGPNDGHNHSAPQQGNTAPVDTTRR
jgi:FKBP-type peptidyl-prolyl cis-trans isomerase FkpA